MLWYQSILLGIIQGLTEFLPISSSGHLVFVPLLLGWAQQPLFFDVMLHAGTLCALLLYFRKDIFSIFKAITENKGSQDARLGLFIIIGSLPAAILGFFFEDTLEAIFRSGLSVATFMFIGTIIMLVAELRIKNSKVQSNVTGTKVLLIGFFQALALFPGVSRSGATISGGMLMGFSREQAARFSFLLSIPIIAGATLFKVLEFVGASEPTVSFFSVVPGFVTSFVIGYLAIDILLRFLKTRSLYIFIIYRFVIVSLLFIVFM